VRASKAVLGSGLTPYRQAVTSGVPLIMLSNAIYDAYDPNNAAGWSRAIGTTLLRGQLGFRGVTITDSLDGAAHARNIATNSLALRAARAGTDLILLTGSEGASRSVYLTLLNAARQGDLDQARLLSSYQRILALKSHL
jgi:beta-N-acetylhexosaminidase